MQMFTFLARAAVGSSGPQLLMAISVTVLPKAVD